MEANTANVFPLVVPLVDNEGVDLVITIDKTRDKQYSGLTHSVEVWKVKWDGAATRPVGAVILKKVESWGAMRREAELLKELGMLVGRSRKGSQEFWLCIKFYTGLPLRETEEYHLILLETEAVARLWLAQKREEAVKEATACYFRLGLKRRRAHTDLKEEHLLFFGADGDREPTVIDWGSAAPLDGVVWLLAHRPDNPIVIDPQGKTPGEIERETIETWMRFQLENAYHYSPQEALEARERFGRPPQ